MIQYQWTLCASFNQNQRSRGDAIRRRNRFTKSNQVFFSIWEKDGTAMWMSMTNVVLVYEILVKYNLKSTAAYNSAVKGFW